MKKNVIQYIKYILIFIPSIILYLIHPFVTIFYDDFLWHIKVGEWIYIHKEIPKEDIFTWIYENTHQIFVSHEWLADYLFFITNKLFHPYFLYIIIVFIIFGIIMINIYKEFDRIDILYKLLIIFLLTSSFLTTSVLRPHLFSFIFFIFLIKELDKIKQENSSKLYIILPLINILWVNMHGGSIILSIIIPFGYLLCSFISIDFYQIKSTKGSFNQRVKYLYITVFNLLCSFINPYGVNIYKYLLSHNSEIKEGVSEWGALSIDIRVPFIAIMLIIISLIFIKKKIELTDLGLLTGFLLLSFMYRRFYSWTIFIYIILFIKYLDSKRKYKMFNKKELFKYIKYGISFGLIIFELSLIMLYINIFNTHQLPKANEYISDIMIEKIKEENPERIYNSYFVGGALVYNDIKPFATPIANANELEMNVSKNLDCLNLDFYKVEDIYNFDYILTYKNSPLENLIKYDKDWELIYSDIDNIKSFYKLSLYKKK